MADSAQSSVKGYSFEDKLGIGVCGAVYKATKGGETYVLKSIDLMQSDGETSAKLKPKVYVSDQEKKRLHKRASKAAVELRKLLGVLPLEHDNLVRFFHSFSSQEKLWAVMEYCSLGNLNDLVLQPSYDSNLSTSLMVGIADGLAHLHDVADLQHKNLKPMNILLSGTRRSPVPKVSDYGISKVLSDLKWSSSMSTTDEPGTGHFMAPEVDEGQSTKGSDIFSMGVIFAAVVDRSSYNSEGTFLVTCVGSRGRLADALKSTTLQDLEEGLVTTLPHGSSMKALILNMLEHDPAVRPSAAGISLAIKKIKEGQVIKLDEIDKADKVVPNGTAEIISVDDDLAEMAELDIKHNEDSEGDSSDDGTSDEDIDGGEGDHDEEDNSDD
ncbi:PDIK1L [Branchiostoma lanceolatum]|uniref:PDIK1L protein n=1 Tax=Branchiostoma lanceolatum TaxID=7740 RepID=A0A8J9VYH9_BRALA|nr:PDIK1L [Branchiostoma lanceolatum]